MKIKKKNEIIRRERVISSGVQLRESSDGGESRTIIGRAILFNTPSAEFYPNDDTEVREIIAPEAITRDLLDDSDIKFTLFHDRNLILARSNKGAGTLSYDVDERGVTFSFEAPHTADGDKALELVRRGDISGCSFAFSTYYYDTNYVERTVTHRKDDRPLVTYTVRQITGVYDMTLTPDPAYPDTSTELRDLLTDTAAEKAEQEQRAAAERQAAEIESIISKY